MAAALSTASSGERRIRKLAFAVDPRARRVRIRFPGGEGVTVRAVRVPKAVGLRARIAWHVDAAEALPTRAVARNRKGKVVGRWRQGMMC